jgi:hypothetical protein
MKRNILFGSVLAAALSVGIGAQTPAGGGQTPTGQPPAGQTPMGGGTQTPRGGAQGGGSMAKGSNDAITVTGCLQPADGSGMGVSKTDPSKADKFVLANVMAGAGASGGAMANPSGSTGTAGASASTGSSASGTSMNYALSGGKKDELRTMANSKVEITGKIDHAPTAGTSNNGATSATGTTGSAMSTGSRAPESEASGRTLKIDTIRKIAGSCS